MSLPGPPPFAAGLALLLAAAALALAGDGLRRLLARVAPPLASLGGIETVLLDLYLGGGALFGLAVAGLFDVPIVIGALLLLSAVALWARREVLARRPTLRGLGTALRGARWSLLAGLSALGLFVVELSVAAGQAGGNTYDASVEGLYVAWLRTHGALPTSISLSGVGPVAYPQGATVWISVLANAAGAAPPQWSLLAVPLFLALVPLAAFALGRAWLGTASAGAAFAVTAAALGPATRLLVASGTDLVVGLPLVLLLAALLPRWTLDPLPGWGSALAWAALVGLAATLAPVGAEWLLLLAGVSAIAARPRFGGRPGGWAARWAVGVLVTLGFAAPTISGIVAGAAAGPIDRGASGIGLYDPFLFRTGDVALSPFPLVRVELALLLVAGILLVARPIAELPERPSRARRPVAAGLASSFVGIALVLGLGNGPEVAQDLAGLSSASQLSVILFALFGGLAAVPLALAFDRLDVGRTFSSDGAVGGARGPPAEGVGSGRRLVPATTAVALVVVLLIVAPGARSSIVELPPYLSATYGAFDHASSADQDLLAWAESHLSAGARVLIAPGSYAQFAAAAVPGVDLVYAMAGDSWLHNATYTDLREQLENGTHGATFDGDLQLLGIDVALVTASNSALFLPFQPGPFFADPGSILLFEEGDAYAFECRVGTP